MKTILWILSAVAIHLLFFNNTPGLNSTAFVWLSSILVIGQNRFRVKNKWALLGLLLLSSISVYNGSFVGLAFSVIGVVAFLGLETESTKQAIFGFWAGLYKLLTGIVIPFGSRKQSNETSPTRFGIRPAHLIIPVGISLLFIGFYASGVPAFGELMESIWKSITDVFSRVFENVSASSIAFFLFLLFITAGLAYRNPYNEITKVEGLWPTKVGKRKHRPSIPALFALALGLVPKLSPVSLKHELKISTIMLIILNAVLVMVLISGYTQVIWPQALSEPGYVKVHEGTYTLIASLVAGATLVVYFFRGNLNFIKKNALLKKLSYLWLAQNLALALLDVVYNAHYISMSGLTYKRLGVYFFLILVVIGLFIVLSKIHYQFSTFRIFTMGLYAVVIAGITASVFNWDAHIVHHNLKHQQRSEIDLKYLTDLSYKAIPALISHKEFYDAPIGLYQATYQERLEGMMYQFDLNKGNSLWSSSYLKWQVQQARNDYNPTSSISHD